MEEMKYIVSIGYNKFEFKDGVVALDFARTAKKTYTKERYDRDIEVTIEIDIVTPEVAENKED